MRTARQPTHRGLAAYQAAVFRQESASTRPVARVLPSGELSDQPGTLVDLVMPRPAEPVRPSPKRVARPPGR